MSGRKTIQDFLSSNKVDIAKLLTLALKKTKEDLEFAKDAKCPTCGQELRDDKHEHLVTQLNSN